MRDPKNKADELPVNLLLDEEELAQLDALIEEHSTPEHRLTREEMLILLMEKGQELVEQGESLLPYLEEPDLNKDTTKH